MRSRPDFTALETAELIGLLETKTSGRLSKLKGDFLTVKAIVGSRLLHFLLFSNNTLHFSFFIAVCALGNIVAYHPSFPEMPRMEKRPGEFVGVMIGDAYIPRPTNPVRQRFGLEVQTQPVMRGICQIRQSLIHHEIEIADSANA